MIDESEVTRALGWISTELERRAANDRPAWLPEGPEWLELWEQALAAVRLDHDWVNAR